MAMSAFISPLLYDLFEFIIDFFIDMFYIVKRSYNVNTGF